MLTRSNAVVALGYIDAPVICNPVTVIIWAPGDESVIDVVLVLLTMSVTCQAGLSMPVRNCSELSAGKFRTFTSMDALTPVPEAGFPLGVTM
jgi:hypothetical protein